MFATLCLVSLVAALVLFKWSWLLSLALITFAIYCGNKSSLTGDDVESILGTLAVIGFVLAVLGGAVVQVWNY